MEQFATVQHRVLRSLVGAFVNASRRPWIAVIALYFVSAMISPDMFQVSHLFNMPLVAAFVSVITYSHTVVLLIGGIDLSQAGTVTLINISSASLMMGKIAPAAATCLLVVVYIGLPNAVFIVFLRVKPLIATLSVDSILFSSAHGLCLRRA